MERKTLKKYQASVEVVTPYIFETYAESELQARQQFMSGQCAYLSKGPDKRKIAKVEEVQRDEEGL